MTTRRIVAWSLVPVVLAMGTGLALLLDALGQVTGRDVAYGVTCALLPVATTAGWHLDGSGRGETLTGGLLVSSLGVGPLLLILGMPLSAAGQTFGAVTFMVAAGVWVAATVLVTLVFLVHETFKAQSKRVRGLALLPPLALGLAAAAVWMLDRAGLGPARDAVYVLAAVLVPLSVVPAFRAAAPDRTDVVVHRASNAVIALGLAGAFLVVPAALAGHVFGAVVIGAAAAVWFVLGWVGVSRTAHLIADTYGEGQWAPW